MERFTTVNADRLVEGCDLVLDGTDNYDTRYIINSTCAHARILIYMVPYVDSRDKYLSSMPGTNRVRTQNYILPKSVGQTSLPTCAYWA